MSTLTLSGAGPGAVSGYTPNAGVLALAPVAWWDASSLALADGDPVASWLDYSGNNRTGTAAGAQRPTYKTNIQNGKPVVRVAASQWLDYTTVALADFTVFLAHSVSASSANYGGPLSWRKASEAGFVLTNYVASGDYLPNCELWDGTAGGVARRKAGTGSGQAVAFKAITWTRNAGSPLVYENGVVASMQGGDVGHNTQQRIGQGYQSSFAGDIAEIIVFSSTLNGTDRGTVESYLMTKYGL